MRRGVRAIGRVVGRLLQLVAIAVSLVLMAVLVLVAITTNRGLPETTGQLAVPGLHAAVTVTRDPAGIIQITAEDRHDLFLAQGYIHAQERMWQMEISRRIGAGRLSELFGKSTLDKDRYIRTLGWRQAAGRDLAAISRDSTAILEAYAEGVNAWITQHDGRLSTPFVVAGLLSGTGGLGGYTLEPWTPLDSATWQKVQAWSLGANADSEIFRLLADAQLGSAARTDELFPPYDPAAPVITPSGIAGSGGAVVPTGAAAAASRSAPTGASSSSVAGVARFADAHAIALGELGRLGDEIAGLAGFDRGAGLVGGHGVGSNNWVVSGAHTECGKPVLANDPHLGFSMPSVWIMNGLHCRTVSEGCPWDVIGVSFPGAPAVVLGHNASIAWGATNVGPDTQDLFEERPDPSDPAGQYIHDGRSLAYEVRHETITVAGGEDVGLDVRATVHGVVLSDVDPRLKDGPVLAIRWTTTAEVDRALESFFRINTASSFDEFRAAFDGYGSPSQNFVYADVDGHIGYVLPGLVPVRAGPNGDRVRDGESGDEEWLGYVPAQELPWQLDPEGGQIVTANNAPVDATYPHWLGSEWDPGYRAARIGELLADLGDQVTADAVRKIQLDTFVPRSGEVIRRLAALGPRPTTEDGRILFQRMLDWDGTCSIDSPGCAAYMSIELALQRTIFDDDLGPIARDYVGTPPAWQALIDVLGKPGSPWWDAPPGGAADHDPAARAAEAIDATAAELRGGYGEPATWTWGKLHTVTFRESTLGSSGLLPLELYFNPPGRAVAGADGAIDNNYYRAIDAYPDPADASHVPIANRDTFKVTNGPSLRFSIDLSDLDAARIVITTGQSGNTFDRHYGDLIPLWANGDTVPLPFSAANVAASAVDTLTLRPSD